MTTPNIGDFEKAIARLEEAEKVLLEAIRLLGFRTLEEFKEYCRLEDCKRRSFRTRISEGIKKMIEGKRANLKKEVIR